jgi:hypothetical protein
LHTPTSHMDTRTHRETNACARAHTHTQHATRNTHEHLCARLNSTQTSAQLVQSAGKQR